MKWWSDMRFVKNFTPPDFQAENFIPFISQNFNSFGDKNTKKMSENGKIYTAGKNFTLLPAVTAVTNLTSEYPVSKPTFCFSTQTPETG